MPTKEWYEKRFTGLHARRRAAQPRHRPGELLVSPLQLALMTSVVANGGGPVRPHVVMKVQGVPGVQDREAERGLEAAPEIWAGRARRDEGVVDAGTATSARIPGFGASGKTGTAQNPHGKDHALFVCYASTDAPRIAIAIVAENSGHGGQRLCPSRRACCAACCSGDLLRRRRVPAAKRDSTRAAAPTRRTPVTRFRLPHSTGRSRSPCAGSSASGCLTVYSATSIPGAHRGLG